MGRKKIKPLAKPGFTMFNNYILDHIMPNLSHTAWKVLCVAIRNTIGWADDNTESGRKEKDRIAYSQFVEKTGIKSNTTISTAIQENLDKGYLLRESSEKHPQMYDYSLNQDYEIEVETCPKNGQVQEACPKNGQVLDETCPKNGHTKENSKEIQMEKESFSASAESKPPDDGMLLPEDDEPQRGYRPGPGRIVQCEDPDTGKTVGEPTWRFPQTQRQHQAFLVTGRRRFRSKAEYNKMRRIEQMLENGELPEDFWEERKASATKHRWSFPKLLQYTLDEDLLRKWEAKQ